MKYGLRSNGVYAIQFCVALDAATIFDNCPYVQDVFVSKADDTISGWVRAANGDTFSLTVTDYLVWYGDSDNAYINVMREDEFNKTYVWLGD